jgi:hypothetical protein
MSASSSSAGLKTFYWGGHYWQLLHLFAHQLNAEQLCADFAVFVFLSPAALLPCVFCRRSYEHFTSLPEYNVCWCVQHGRLPELAYLLHNAVNCKLSKPPLPFADAQRKVLREVAAFDRCWTPNFWFVLEAIAFNYPRIGPEDPTAAAPALPAGDNTNDDEERTKTKGLADDKQRRAAAYVTFFVTLKSVLPDACDMSQRWTAAYFCHAPSAVTFSSRAALLKWIFELELLCGYRDPARASFSEMMERLFPLRASACTQDLNGCW